MNRNNETDLILEETDMHQALASANEIRRFDSSHTISGKKENETIFTGLY